MSELVAMSRLVLRRDRLRIAIWTASIVVLVFAGASSVKSLYRDPADLEQYARTVENNVAVIAFTGPTYSIETLGGRIAFETSTQVALAIGLMALLAMTRHTRAEEESGRAELLRSTPMGRHTGLVAALLVTSAVCAAIGAGTAAALMAIGLPAAGSVTLGAVITAVGLFFAAVGAVTAQVTEHTRGASGLAFAVLGVAFVVRAVGDTSTPVLRWLSPIGIAQHSRAFAGERWWPLLVLLAMAAALVVLAVHLAGRRDLGAGLVPDRPGPARAAPSLGSPFGLALRLQRGVLVSWTVGIFVFAALMGAIAESAEELIGDSEQMRDIMAQAGITDVVDSFLATMLVMTSLTASGFVVQSILRLRSEETAGRSEMILATGVSRRGWISANVVVTVVGTAVVLLAAGLGTGGAHALQTADAAQVPRLIGAALVHAPAVLVLAAVAVLVFGLVPRAIGLVWLPLAFAGVVGVLGDLLRIPGWLAALSPFDHLPAVPARSAAVVALPVLALIAVAATGLGLLAYERRDVG
ncbi:MAG TPA: hypothetical protein VM262_07390 [Acidimicrobiales bacterium]|nr:hypothetical protein [Acidimicrobiales bacterium]